MSYVYATFIVFAWLICLGIMWLASEIIGFWPFWIIFAIIGVAWLVRDEFGV